LFVVIKRVSLGTSLSRSRFFVLTKTQQTLWTSVHHLPGALCENSAVQGNWSKAEVQLLKNSRQRNKKKKKSCAYFLFSIFSTKLPHKKSHRL